MRSSRHGSYRGDLLMDVDITTLARERAREIISRQEGGAWAACASIWSRILVLSSPAWEERREWNSVLNEAFILAIRRAAAAGASVPGGALLASLEGFDIEDDGSIEWNYMIDLIEMISVVIENRDIESCLETAVRVFLEGAFGLRVREYASKDGGPVSYADAKMKAAEDDEWIRAVDFVRSLLRHSRVTTKKAALRTK